MNFLMEMMLLHFCWKPTENSRREIFFPKKQESPCRMRDEYGIIPCMRLEKRRGMMLPIRRGGADHGLIQGRKCA